jgi:hypothetical protein
MTIRPRLLVYTLLPNKVPDGWIQGQTQWFIFPGGSDRAHAMQGHDSFYGGYKIMQNIIFIACYSHNWIFSVFLLFKAWNNHRIIMQNIIFIAGYFYNGAFSVLFVIQCLE